MDDIFDKPIVRYPLAATAILAGVYLLTQPVVPGNITMLGVVMIACALWAVRPVIIWALIASLVVGFLMAVVGLLAALPVSAAVVIGAIILASGKR